MNLRDYLMSLEWNSFERYPTQGESVYIHIYSSDGEIHNFAKIREFNAVGFDLRKLFQKIAPNKQLYCDWLPAKSIKYKDYV